MSAENDRPKTHPVSHIRRCHVCGTVNEIEGSSNLSCQSCGKHLAPFYFFDESSLEGLSESELHLSKIAALKERQSDAVGFQPIWGLSTYWTEEGLDHETDDRRHQKSTHQYSRRHSRN